MVIVLTYSISIAAIPEIQNLKQISFENLNQHGKLVSKDNFHAIQEYLLLIDQIRDHFHYPQFYNCLLTNYVIFTTSHWPSVDQLNEPKRIKWICEYASQIINHGCNHIANTIGSNKLDQLVKALSKMDALAKQNNSPW